MSQTSDQFKLEYIGTDHSHPSVLLALAYPMSTVVRLENGVMMVVSLKSLQTDSKQLDDYVGRVLREHGLINQP